MPRQSKPYYRKSRDTWICTIKGKRITLGKTKKAAFQKFHELMADQEKIATETFTLYQLSQKYLDWVEVNRKPATYSHAHTYLKSFIGHVGKKLKPTNLKASVVKEWLRLVDLIQPPRQVLSVL